MATTAARTPALELAQLARTTLEEKKARDIVMLDVRGISTITDYVLIATGASGPQLKAMSVAVGRALKGAGAPPYRTAGEADSGWVVVDCIDVVMHMFSPKAREYYAVETLWEQAPRLE